MTESAIETFTRVEAEIARAMAAGDAAGVAAHYTPDALLMPPFQPPIVGREAIAAHYRGIFERFAVRVETRVEEAKVVGDLAYIRGAFTDLLTPRSGGKAASNQGKYLVILERQGDGSWRFARDIFNHDRLPTVSLRLLLGLVLGRLFRRS